MMIRKKGKLIGALSLLLVFALINCASVEKRYKKGQEMESKGRLEEAAQRYIKVLAKDPSMQDARVRLEDVADPRRRDRRQRRCGTDGVNTLSLTLSLPYRKQSFSPQYFFIQSENPHEGRGLRKVASQGVTTPWPRHRAQVSIRSVC